MHLSPCDNFNEGKEYQASVQNGDGQQVRDEQRHAEQGEELECADDAHLQTGSKAFLYGVSEHCRDADRPGNRLGYVDALKEDADALEGQRNEVSALFCPLCDCRNGGVGTVVPFRYGILRGNDAQLSCSRLLIEQGMGGNLEDFTVPVHRYADVLIGMGCNVAGQVAEILHFLPVDCSNRIPAHHTRLVGRRSHVFVQLVSHRNLCSGAVVAVTHQGDDVKGNEAEE